MTWFDASEGDLIAIDGVVRKYTNGSWTIPASVTTAERDAIAGATVGTRIFNSTTTRYEELTETGWAAAGVTGSQLSDHIADTANPHSVTKSQVGLANVDDTADAAKPVSTATQTALDLKAPLASPTFTGNVIVPLPASDDDSLKAAPTSWVVDKIAAATGLTLGTGVATFLATPSSANLAAAVTDETGTGALVLANSPTLVTPALGTPSALVLTNATGLPAGGINISAQYAILGRKSSGAGVAEECTLAEIGALAQGKHTIWIPATAMVSRTTNGPASGTVEMSTNKNMFKTLNFDASTAEYAQFAIRMPKSWNEGTVTFAPVWSHASTSTNFGVVFSLAGVAVSNDDAGDVAFGTVQSSTDTGGTTNDIYEGPESSAITIAGSPAANDYVMFQVARVPSDGSDTMAIDARLHGVVLFYTIDTSTDA